jgi:chemotaxis signal transduction protein
VSERDPLLGGAGEDTLAASLGEIREAFDASFAVAPARARADEVPLLTIRVANDVVALRVHETLGLLKAGKIVPVPSRRPELLGVTGVRGAVIPVYSVARLTGRGEGETPRWIVLCTALERADRPTGAEQSAGGVRIGLAFAEFQGHVRVPPEAIHAATSARDRASVSGVVELAGQMRPILDVVALVRAATGAPGHAADQKGG